MSITTNNEVGRLFSLAFGKEWIRAGLLPRSDDELSQIDSLAEDHASNALIQIAALGKALGNAGDTDLDVRPIGWAISQLAEYASVVSLISGFARESRNPEIRRTNERIVRDLA